jgi:hypothetical protein
MEAQERRGFPEVEHDRGVGFAGAVVHLVQWALRPENRNQSSIGTWAKLSFGRRFGLARASGYDCWSPKFAAFFGRGKFECLLCPKFVYIFGTNK